MIAREVPAGCETGILKGLYKFRPGVADKKHKAQIFGSGAILREAFSSPDFQLVAGLDGDYLFRVLPTP